MIYLRPNPASKPVRYTEVIEKSGLVVSEKHSIALYTCASGAKQGATGATGAPGADGAPYLYDTIIASASDEYSPLEVDLITPATHFRSPFPMNIAFIRVSLSIAPTGADVIIDIHMNGASMFTAGNLLHIDIGSKTSVGSVSPPIYAITSIPDDAEYTVFITQVGATITGSGVKVAVTGTKVVA